MSTSLRSPFEDHEIHSSPATSGCPDESRKRKRPAQPTREFGLMRDTGEHDRARFVGSGSGIHYIRAVYLRLARKSLMRTNGLSSKNLVPGEDDQLRGVETTSEQTALWRQGEISVDTSDKPSFEDLVDWSKSYFESWHPVLPFLHGPDALRIFQEVSDNGVSSLHPLDHAILKSILSICLSDRRQGTSGSHPLPSDLVFQTVQEAVATSQFALSQPASIRSTQAALSIQVFLISMLCLNAASRLGGLIVRMAFHLGLHRCPARFAFFTAEDVRIRQRVFWCIYSLERFLCQSLGLPLDMHDDDLDVCYPGDERHGVMGNGDGDSERLQLLTYISKHARIRGLIMELRNKNVKSRHDTAERTAYVEAEFAKWNNEIQDLLEDEDPEEPTVSPSHRLILSVLKHESTICLHRPLMASVPFSPSYSSALQTCISAAKSILISLKRHLHQHRPSDEPGSPQSRAPLTWPSFTWAVWISTFVLLHAASEHQIGLENALKQVSAGKDILRHIATRDTSWPEYCLQAVDELTFVVKELLQPQPGAQISNTSPATIASCSDTGPGTGARNPPMKGRVRNQEADSIAGTHHATNTRSNDAAGSPSVEGLPSSSLLTESPNPPLSSSRLLPQSIQSQLPSYVPASPSTLNTTSQFNTNHTQRQRLESPQVTDTGIQYLSGTQQSPTLAPESSSSAFLSHTHDSFLDLIPIEGQESIKWYDQLFQSSFSAIDNPFLVAAEFDGSINPTWDYLR